LNDFLGETLFENQKGTITVRAGHRQHFIFQPGQVVYGLIVQIAYDQEGVQTRSGIYLDSGVGANCKKNSVWQVENGGGRGFKQIGIEFGQQGWGLGL